MSDFIKYKKRKFEKSIFIANPVCPNFSKDKKAYILRILNDKMVKKCFDGCYIIKIDEILNISSCSIITSNLNGNGNVNVKFIAIVRCFEVGELLCGGLIAKTQPYIFGNYKETYEDIEISATFAIPHGIHIEPLPLEKSIRSIREAQNIPMRIIGVNHKCGEAKAAIVVTLLVCHKKYNKYIINSPLTELGMSHIRPILDAIKTEMELRDEIVNGEDEDVKKNILFFESLLYSISTNTNYTNINMSSSVEIISNEYSKWWGPAETTVETTTPAINLLEYFNTENPNTIGIWSRPLNIYKSSPMAVLEPIESASIEHTVEPTKKYFDILEEGNADTVFIRFFKDMLDYLIIIRKMSEFYSSNALIMAHKNIWDAMKEVQIIP